MKKYLRSILLKLGAVLLSALLGIGTPDTLCALLLFSEDISQGGTYNQNQNKYNYGIFHCSVPFHQALWFYFALFSALSFLSDFIHRAVITAAKTPTTASPGKKPLPNEPVVISVPS